jgi:hypothetical protein
MPGIRILFLASNPTMGSWPHLALDKEARAIEIRLRASGAGSAVELWSRWAVRPDDLLQILNELRPRVAHFSGRETSTAELIPVDEAGEPKPVSKNALVSLLRIPQERYPRRHTERRLRSCAGHCDHSGHRLRDWDERGDERSGSHRLRRRVLPTSWLRRFRVTRLIRPESTRSVTPVDSPPRQAQPGR